MMKRLPTLFLTLLIGFTLMGADGCSSDPNVEGAKLDLRNNDYDRALENIETALENNPENAEAHYMKGQILLAQADQTSDTEAYEQMAEEMAAAFRRSVELDPARAADVETRLRIAYVNAFEKGGQAFTRGQTDSTQYRVAADFFGTASMIMPDSAGALVNESFALLNAGDQMGSMETLEAAIERGENSVQSYTLLAQLYQANDRAADAVTLLEEANEAFAGDVDPANRDAILESLLSAYQIANQMDRAMELYSGFVERNPDNELYRYNYGTLLLQANEYAAARDQFLAAVQIDPEYANAQYNLGAVYINQAVDVNDQISELDDQRRAPETTEEESAALEERIDALVEERRSLFELAVEPLERARDLTEMDGGDVGPICRALLQAYANTNQMEKAEQVQECAE
jgi:tetratricopeptide (TPR) repeat protein